MNDTLLLYSLAWITQRLYNDGYCCYFLWLMAHLSALLILPLLSLPTPLLSPTLPPIPLLYLILCRPQAGDDLWLLEDGLAGELLQYCHDHQAGGSGQGRFPIPLSFDLLSTVWRWMEGMYLRSSLYHSLYIRIAAAPPRVVGGNGCRCQIMSDHLLLLWPCSKVKALMYMRDHGGTLWPLF